MKPKLSKSDLAYASKLHKLSLTQAKKVAINAGWHEKLVVEVANLDYGIGAIKELIRQEDATKFQGDALLEVLYASRLEFAAKFALSQA